MFDPNGSPNVGVTVFVDLNRNGAADAGETTQTDDLGRYAFHGVPVSPTGGYTVVADNQGATVSVAGVMVAAGTAKAVDLQFPAD